MMVPTANNLADVAKHLNNAAVTLNKEASKTNTPVVVGKNLNKSALKLNMAAKNVAMNAKNVLNSKPVNTRMLTKNIAAASKNVMGVVNKNSAANATKLSTVNAIVEANKHVKKANASMVKAHKHNINSGSKRVAVVKNTPRGILVKFNVTNAKNTGKSIFRGNGTTSKIFKGKNGRSFTKTTGIQGNTRLPLFGHAETFF